MRAKRKTIKDPGFCLAGFCALGSREGFKDVSVFVLEKCSFRKLHYGSSLGPMRRWGQAFGTQKLTHPRLPVWVLFTKSLCVPLCTLLFSHHPTWVLWKKHTWEAGLTVENAASPVSVATQGLHM